MTLLIYLKHACSEPVRRRLVTQSVSVGQIVGGQTAINELLHCDFFICLAHWG